MLVKNLSMSESLVNGTRGCVVGFERSSGRSRYPELPVVQFDGVAEASIEPICVVLKEELWEISDGKM
jgi:hypothetical protein